VSSPSNKATTLQYAEYKVHVIKLVNSTHFKKFRYKFSLATHNSKVDISETNVVICNRTGHSKINRDLQSQARENKHRTLQNRPTLPSNQPSDWQRNPIRIRKRTLHTLSMSFADCNGSLWPLRGKSITSDERGVGESEFLRHGQPLPHLLFLPVPFPFRTSFPQVAVTTAAAAAPSCTATVLRICRRRRARVPWSRRPRGGRNVGRWRRGRAAQE
jgi:hypothetical protein